MATLFQINFGNGFVQVAPPINHSAIKIELDWSSQQPSATVQSINFEWVNDTAKKINDYIAAGLSGGPGIYEGLPLRITVCPTAAPFEMMLDLVHEAAVFECDRVVCPMKESGRIDWLNDIAASFTFSYLASADYAQLPNHPGLILETDYKRVPYCITELPNYSQIVTLSITFFLISWQIADVATAVEAQVSKISGDVSSLAGVFTAGNVALVVADTIVLGLLVVYIVALVTMLIDLVNQMVTNIIQRGKFKLAMREEDLFIKGCQYLGLNFSSSIYSAEFKDAMWMPRKIVTPKYKDSLSLVNFKNEVNSFINVNQHDSDLFDRPANESPKGGAPPGVYGYFDGTFKEFIDAMSAKYDATVVVKNGTLYFEHTHNADSPYIVPNTGEVANTFNYPSPYGTNAHEIPFVYNLQFQVDESELNTINRYRGTTASYTYTPNTFNNKKNINTTPGKVVTLPCALAKRKEYITDVEQLALKVVKGVQKIASPIINTINASITFINAKISAISIGAAIAALLLGNPLLAAGFVIGGNAMPQVKLIQTQTFADVDFDREGWMELSNDGFTVPKTFIGEYRREHDAWYLKEDFPTEIPTMSAQNLMDKFHKDNLIPYNQYLTYTGKKFPFCCDDFAQVLNTNRLQLSDGRRGKFTKMLWHLENEQVENADYRIKQNFTNNYSVHISIDGEAT